MQVNDSWRAMKVMIEVIEEIEGIDAIEDLLLKGGSKLGKEEAGTHEMVSYLCEINFR